MNKRATVTKAEIEPDVDGFARELSELCRKYGIGITGTPTMFVMERDDFQLNYRADGNGNLALA